ncbi:MAG: YggU family protein [Methanobacteriota archaeon]|nr:MAG: YggU family protein [Euryarchaeota archaeon]
MQFKDAVRSESGNVVVRFHVSPGSSKSGFEDYDPWRTCIKVNVKSQAKKGAANSELVTLLSNSFGIEESEVKIVSGTKSRSKTVSIQGIEKEEVLRILRELLREG